MMDEALLRPGRLEVQIEIGLPNEKGRSQILKVIMMMMMMMMMMMIMMTVPQIHTRKMKENGKLGSTVRDRLEELATMTKNFSGAELEVSQGLARDTEIDHLLNWIWDMTWRIHHNSSSSITRVLCALPSPAPSTAW